MWAANGLTVDSRKSIGSIFAVKSPAAEVSIAEKEDTVLLTLVHREKSKKWEMRFPVGDKVLKLRAHVQQRIMIPLSRCVLKYAGQPMWDRHSLDHYNLTDGCIVEVSQE